MNCEQLTREIESLASYVHPEIGEGRTAHGYPYVSYAGRVRGPMNQLSEAYLCRWLLRGLAERLQYTEAFTQPVYVEKAEGGDCVLLPERFLYWRELPTVSEHDSHVWIMTRLVFLSRYAIDKARDSGSGEGGKDA